MFPLNLLKLLDCNLASCNLNHEPTDKDIDYRKSCNLALCNLKLNKFKDAYLELKEKIVISQCAI